MEIQREIIIYHTNEKKTISILPTDSDNIILSKIKSVVNKQKPTFVFLPLQFSIQKLKENENYNPIILDLEILPILELENTPNADPNKAPTKKVIFKNNLLEQILPLFSFENRNIYYFLLFRIALCIPYFSSSLLLEKISIKKNPALTLSEKKEIFAKKRAERDEKHKKIMKENEEKATFIDEKILVPFNVVLSEEHKNKFNKHRYSSNKLIHQFAEEHRQDLSLTRSDMEIENILDRKYGETLTMIQENEKNLKDSCDSFEFFSQIPNKLSSDTEFHGRIFNIHMKTSQYSSGIIFNNLKLNEYLPIAHYKTFFKLYKDYSTNITSQENDNLYIYRREENGENIQLFCQNTDDGVFIQVLLLSNSFLDTLDSVYSFLNFDKDLMNSIYTKQTGILGEFEFLDSSFYNSIMSEMIINGKTFVNDTYSVPLFSLFLSVNDSDKISKDNNSIYIYYKQIRKKNNDKKEIYVGGWNKETSRFGDLTATLTPLRKDDKLMIHVKIHRVYHENTLNEFKFIMGKLLNLYQIEENKTLEKYNTYFQNQRFDPNNPYRQYLPNIRDLLKPISEVKVSSKVGSLGYENKMLFPGEYVRVCQPTERKPILFKNENQIDTLNLNEEEKSKRVLMYPKIGKTFKNSILKPNFYYCKTNEYPYIGYVEIKKKSEEHPYSGYTPCCFKTSRLKNNKEVEKFLYESASLEKESKMTGYKIKKSKVIEHTGQMGELPNAVKSFFTSIEPRLNFVRVGIKNEYATSSLFHCCDYGIRYEKNVNIELNKEIRNEILKERGKTCPLELISQENTLYGLEFIRHVLENDRNFINVRQVYRLVQDYFGINLIVINTMGEIVRPNSYLNYKTVFYEKEIFIILLEHDTPKRYELIGVEKDKTLEFCSFSNKLYFYPQLEFIFHQSFQIKENNNILPIITYRQYNFWRQRIQNTTIQSQVLTKSGQCILLNLKYNNQIIPVYFNVSMPPFDSKQVDYISVPKYYYVELFLKNVFPHKKIEIIKITTEYSYIFIDDSYCFPFITDNTVVYTREETFHNYLFLIKPKSTSITRFTNFLNCYTLIGVMKDYMLLLLGKFIEDNNMKDINDSDNIISLFKTKCIDFVSGKDYMVNYIHCLKNGNKWMFDGNRLKLPHETKEIIDYFLLWNLTNNEEYLKKWKNTQELDYYHFTNQFNTYIHNNIQLCSQGHNDTNFTPYHDFSVHENVNVLFKDKTLYYHYDKDTSEIKPFFIVYGKSLSDDNWNYIFSVMDWYYKKKVFTFYPEDHVNDTEFRNHFKIYSFPKDEDVNEPVKLRKRRKKKNLNESEDNSESEEFKVQAPKRRLHFTMILFDFL